MAAAAGETILVGTYNMSFASDSGLNPDGNGNFASEATFLKSNKSGIPRQFWLNALKNVEAFVAQENAGFIGFQEINKTDAGSGTGSDALETAIKSIKPQFAVVTEKALIPLFLRLQLRGIPANLVMKLNMLFMILTIFQMSQILKQDHRLVAQY